MPYKVYESDPAWAAGAGNLASALFPDPAKQMQYQALALKGRETEQDIRAKHRELNLADMLMDATRGNNTNEMYALGAGMSPQHMNAMPGFALGRAATPGAGTSDEDLHRMGFGSGMNLGPDSSVSIGRQDAVSARNAQEAYRLAMDKERLSQAGQNSRYEPESTAAMRNQQWRIADRLRANPGMTYAQAQAAEFGDVTTRTNDVTGMDVRANRATGIIDPLQWAPGSLDGINQIPEWTASQSRYSDLPMEGATGIRGNLMQGANKAFGGVGLDEPFPEVGNYFNEANRLATRSAIQWASEVNSRPAVRLVEMFQELAVQPNKWFQGNEAVQRQLADINAEAQRVISQTENRYRAGAERMSAAERGVVHTELQALNNMVQDTGELMNLFSRGPAAGTINRPGDPPPLEVNVGGGGGGEQQFPPGTRTFENPDTGERKAVLPDGREFMY